MNFFKHFLPWSNFVKKLKQKRKKERKRSKEIKQTQGVRLQSGRCSTIPTRLPKQVQVQEHTHTKHPDIFTKCNVCKASKSVAHSLHCTSRHEVVEKHKYVSMYVSVCGERKLRFRANAGGKNRLYRFRQHYSVPTGTHHGCITTTLLRIHRVLFCVDLDHMTGLAFPVKLKSAGYYIFAWWRWKQMSEVTQASSPGNLSANDAEWIGGLLGDQHRCHCNQRKQHSAYQVREWWTKRWRDTPYWWHLLCSYILAWMGRGRDVL